MAYRPLVVGDNVKVKPLDVMHPQLQYSNDFGKVIEVSSVGAEVSFSGGYTEHRVWLKQSNLMVASDDLSGSIYRFRYAEQKTVDDEDECEYANYSHEDLVELIGFLKNELAKLEN